MAGKSEKQSVSEFDKQIKQYVDQLPADSPLFESGAYVTVSGERVWLGGTVLQALQAASV